MSRILLILAALLLAFPTSAEEYEKGPNGGLMLDVAGIDDIRHHCHHQCLQGLQSDADFDQGLFRGGAYCERGRARDGYPYAVRRKFAKG